MDQLPFTEKQDELSDAMYRVSGLENIDIDSIRTLVGHQYKTDTDIIAALEAINWAKVGKWGLVAVVLSAIAGLINKIRGNYKKGQQLVADDAFRRSFGDLFQDVTDEQLLRVKKLNAALESEGGKIKGWDLKEAFSKEQYLETMQKLKPVLDRLLKKNIPLKAYYELPLKEMLDPEASRYSTGDTVSKVYKFCYEHVFSEEQQSKLVLFNNAFNDPEVSKKIDDFLTHEEKRVKAGEGDVTESIKETLDKIYAAYDANKLDGNLVYDASSNMHRIYDQLEKAQSDQYHLSNEVFGESKISRMEALLRPKVEHLLSDVNFAGQDYFLKLSSDSSLDKNSHLKRAMDLLAPLSKNKEALNKKVAELSKLIETGNAKLKGATSSDPEDVPKEFTHMCNELFKWLDKIAVQVANTNQNDLKVIAAVNLYIQTAQTGINDFNVMSSMAKSIIRVMTDPTHLSGANMQPKTLTAALEAMERSDVIDYDFIDNFDQYVKETHRVTAGLEAISSRIRMTGVISLYDYNELEKISPGVLSAHPSTKHLKFSAAGSKAGTVAALEAINWAAIGKWGIIGIIIAAIAALINRVIKNRSAAIQSADAAAKTVDDLNKMNDDTLESIEGLIDEIQKQAIIAERYKQGSVILKQQHAEGEVRRAADRQQWANEKGSIDSTATSVDMSAVRIEAVVEEQSGGALKSAEVAFDKQLERKITPTLKRLGMAPPPKFSLGKQFDVNLQQRLDKELTDLGFEFKFNISNYVKECVIQGAKKHRIKAMPDNPLDLNFVLYSDQIHSAILHLMEDDSGIDTRRMGLVLDLLNDIDSSRQMESYIRSAHESVIDCGVGIEKSAKIVDKVCLSILNSKDPDAIENSEGLNGLNGTVSAVQGHAVMCLNYTYFLQQYERSTEKNKYQGTVEAYNRAHLAGNKNEQILPLPSLVKSTTDQLFSEGDVNKSDRESSSKYASGIHGGYGAGVLARFILEYIEEGSKNVLLISVGSLRAKMEGVLSISDAKQMEAIGKSLTTSLKSIGETSAKVKAKYTGSTRFEEWEGRVTSTLNTAALDAQWIESKLVLFTMRHVKSLDDLLIVVGMINRYMQFVVEIRNARGKENYILQGALDSMVESNQTVAGNESLSGMAKFGLVGGFVAMFIAIIRKIIQIVRRRAADQNRQKALSNREAEFAAMDTTDSHGWRRTLKVFEELEKGDAALAYYLFDAPESINLDTVTLIRKVYWHDMVAMMNGKLDNVAKRLKAMVAGSTDRSANDSAIEEELDFMAVDLYTARYQVGERVEQVIRVWFEDYQIPQRATAIADVATLSKDPDVIGRLKTIREILNDHSPGTRSTDEYRKNIEDMKRTITDQESEIKLAPIAKALKDMISQFSMYGNGTGSRESDMVYADLAKEGELQQKVLKTIGEAASAASSSGDDFLVSCSRRLQQYYNDFSEISMLIADIDCRMILIYDHANSKL